eukprot:Pompholyxophrys_sp_v1_NODE_7_length_5994_cov_24.204748.p5 type:complete len:118 gc:universal NODE_7_length_5994_cov_24.204748:4904-5257(+)
MPPKVCSDTCTLLHLNPRFCLHMHLIHTLFAYSTHTLAHTLNPQTAPALPCIPHLPPLSSDNPCLRAVTLPPTPKNARAMPIAPAPLSHHNTPTLVRISHPFADTDQPCYCTQAQPL